MRLIDADTLKAEFTGNFNELWHYTGVRAVIENAPTIDAVTVVRCKDCSNRDTDTCPAYQSIFGDMYDDDYCSFGEQKEVQE